MGKKLIGALLFIGVAAMLGFYLGLNWLESRGVAESAVPTATAVTINNDLEADVIQLATLVLTPTAIGNRPAAAATTEPTAQTIAAAATNTPLPPATSTTAPCVYAYTLLQDVTIPPGTQMAPGAVFNKTWRIRNDGTCAWSAGSAWVFAGGSQMNAPDLVTLPPASPGQSVDVTVAMSAPPSPGSFAGTWQPRMANGQLLNPQAAVSIVVVAATVVAPTAVPPTATPVFANWRGEYFNNTTLSGTPAFVRDDPEIKFDWGATSPGPGLTNANYSVRWTQSISAPAGTYRFFAKSDDGVRVWVNGIQLFDEWNEGPSATFRSDITLQQGEILDVRVEYYQGLGLAYVHVWAELQSNFPNWRGSYYRNTTLQGTPNLIRNDLDVNFNWGTGSPGAGIPSDNFSVAWIRTLTFAPGIYNFYAEVDDGMRLMLNDVMILNAWESGPLRQISATYNVPPGPIDVTITYFERLDNAQIRVWWEQAPFQ